MSSHSGFRFIAVIIGLSIAIAYTLTIVHHGLMLEYRLVSADMLERPWTLMTSMFLHSSTDPTHIIYNLIGLLTFGSILEFYVGSRRFIAIYFASGIIAGIGGSLFYASMIGASGAIFGVIGCLAMIRPRLVVWAVGVPMYMIVAAAVYAGLDLLLFTAADGVAHGAHLFGLALGIVAGLWIRGGTSGSGAHKEPQQEDVITERELDEWERKYMMRPLKQ